jgi:DNA-binding NarL/FixJ family response regulator
MKHAAATSKGESSLRHVRLGSSSTTRSPIKVVIVGGERLFREALWVLLDDQDDFTILGEVANGTEALGLIHKLQPDVVLLDFSASEQDALELLRSVARYSPNTKALLLLTVPDYRRICLALKAGARGYVCKNTSATDLQQAIRVVHRGHLWVEQRLIVEVLQGRPAAPHAIGTSEQPAGGLTDREREVLRSLASGGTNRDIAEALSISEKTVKTHLNNIFRKLNVTRRLQAVLFAIRHGLR